MRALMVQSQRIITDCVGEAMAQRTIEELRGGYRNKVIAGIDYLESKVSEYVESPIEELLIWALLGNEEDPYESFVFPSRFVLGGDGDTSCLFLMPQGCTPYPHTYILQPTVIACGRRYRLDIAFESGDPKTSGRVYVAIECDGHEFHETTREQAESDKRRDRDLQSIGWTIARFTGSEIFRDPHATAKSVMDLAHAQLQLRMDAAVNALARQKKGGR